MSGQVSYHAGLAAERQVADYYIGRGARVLAERWRGQQGEVDLILRGAEGLIFVEVKTSRTVELAAQRLTHHQIQRVSRAGAEFADRQGFGPGVPFRVDAALVGRDGRLEVIENVSLH